MNSLFMRHLPKLESLVPPKANSPAIDPSRLSTDLIWRILDAEGDLSGLSDADLFELEGARLRPAEDQNEPKQR